MSRLIFGLGIILMIVGVIGMVFGVFTVPTQFANTLSQATNPDAASLCKPGESLATEVGPEEYDITQKTYDRSTTFYCVNSAGVRRDVSQQFADGFVQRIFSTFGSAIIPVISFVLCTCGFMFAIFGGIFMMRRRVVNTVVNPYQYATPTGQAIPMANQPSSFGDPALAAKLNQIEEARRNGLITDEEYQKMRGDVGDTVNPVPSSPTPSSTSSLSNKVLAAKLNQIEEARKSGLITEDEYQKMRKDAIDTLS